MAAAAAIQDRHMLSVPLTAWHWYVLIQEHVKSLDGVRGEIRAI